MLYIIYNTDTNVYITHKRRMRTLHYNDDAIASFLYIFYLYCDIFSICTCEQNCTSLKIIRAMFSSFTILAENWWCFRLNIYIFILAHKHAQMHIMSCSPCHKSVSYDTIKCVVILAKIHIHENIDEIWFPALPKSSWLYPPQPTKRKIKNPLSPWWYIHRQIYCLSIGASRDMWPNRSNLRHSLG